MSEESHIGLITDFSRYILLSVTSNKSYAHGRGIFVSDFEKIDKDEQFNQLKDFVERNKNESMRISYYNRSISIKGSGFIESFVKILCDEFKMK